MRQQLRTRNRVAVRGKGGRLRSDNGAGRGRDDREMYPFAIFFVVIVAATVLLSLAFTFSLFLLNIDTTVYRFDSIIVWGDIDATT